MRCKGELHECITRFIPSHAHDDPVSARQVGVPRDAGVLPHGGFLRAVF